MSDRPWDMQALDLLQKIASYKTTDEVLSTTEDDDARLELMQENAHLSVDLLDTAIIEARKILKAGE
jgi:hypothetical protein